VGLKESAIQVARLEGKRASTLTLSIIKALESQVSNGPASTWEDRLGELADYLQISDTANSCKVQRKHPAGWVGHGTSMHTGVRLKERRQL
jgi:hypothetical protein